MVYHGTKQTITLNTSKDTCLSPCNSHVKMCGGSNSTKAICLHIRVLKGPGLSGEAVFLGNPEDSGPEDWGTTTCRIIPGLGYVVKITMAIVSPLSRVVPLTNGLNGF